jgi:hypothetical protein
MFGDKANVVSWGLVKGYIYLICEIIEHSIFSMELFVKLMTYFPTYLLLTNPKAFW